MSASPSGSPLNGRTPTPNSGQPQFIRKPRPADPLRQHRPPRPARAPPIPKSVAPKPNGLKPLGAATKSLPPGKHMGPGPAVPNGLRPAPKAQDGFTQSPEGPYTDFPLFTTKRAIREGLRYHVARFASKKEIDPSNQDEFTRPVSLHRRDPKQPPAGKMLKDEDPFAGILDDKEREKAEITRMEKEAQRTADLAQIAPAGNNASAVAAKKNAAFRNEKTTQIHRLDKTEQQKKESDLRYEEALPWHLEDAENKHTWVGSYEAALSDTNVILIIDGGSFKMVPLEKWYKFTQKNQFKTLSIEEAEAKMKAKFKPDRWVMHDQEQQQKDMQKQETRRQLGNLFHVKGESNTYKQSGKSERQDADELDIDGDDLFQDDDEQATVEPDNDEETKNATEKIKREQRGANLFGEGDENEVEKEFEEAEREEEQKKKLGKSMKKALKKRERNYLYDSDSDHPYSSSSNDETSDDEKKNEEDRRKDEEAKLKAKSSSKVPSGASSKGTNTPSGRPSKHGDPNKRHNYLKRPGSPNLSASETSGNESSRKKHKKKHLSSSQPTGTSTPRSPSRPMSPAPSSQPAGSSPRKSSIIKLNLNPSKLSEIQSAPPNPSAIMSDGEATAGEMSDGAGGVRKKSIKLRLGNRSPTPSASRAGSPANGSRAGSPTAPSVSQIQGQNSGISKSASTAPKPVTAEEIVAALPDEGITIGPLLKLFAGRVVDDATKKRFIQMVKENTTYKKESKLLTRKT